MGETMPLKISGRQSGLLAAGGFGFPDVAEFCADTENALRVIMTDFEAELSVSGKGRGRRIQQAESVMMSG